MDWGSARPYAVAPLAGAWIEILRKHKETPLVVVAPLAGAWIEIKSVAAKNEMSGVAPLAGAWIEMRPRNQASAPRGRAPRGRVD